MKMCKKCERPKKLDEFPINRTKKDGRGIYCLECQREYGRDHYKGNRQYYLDKQSARNKRLRDALHLIMLEAKAAPCADCGGSFPPCVMDFDHVRGKKRFEVSVGRAKMVRPAELKKEIKKCDVVCANCHRIRTFGPVA